MKVLPKQFAYLLKHSTLNPREQQAVLELLPHLSFFAIESLSEVLLKDVEGQEKILTDAERKRDALILQFSMEAERKRQQNMPPVLF
ncbi:MAG: hypothetical protein WC882_01745 [Candidatus Gracilibacteria bacterium]